MLLAAGWAKLVATAMVALARIAAARRSRRVLMVASGRRED